MSARGEVPVDHRLPGTPLWLDAYPAETITNRQFAGHPLSDLDRLFLPPALAGLMDRPSAGRLKFIEDDNRGAILPEPAATLDGMAFYLSIKGVGSEVLPFAAERLDRDVVRPLIGPPAVRDRLGPASGSAPERLITGELWLRGSPYGGQGLAHARTALAVSERADLTSLAGFRLAPLVKIARFPPSLEEDLRSIYWYRRYRGPFVQELRLVPSNVRIYFHGRQTVGDSIRWVFDRFGIGSNARALAFELRFVASVVAMLTLFARTLAPDAVPGRYRGLDFHDVWLDKDAVLAPDGAAYFVDLEGIDEVVVERREVREKLEDQVYRSLYEFMFAFEQIESERRRRFLALGDRREHFATVLREALRDDPFARPVETPEGLALEIRNRLSEEPLNTIFPLVDR